MSIKYSLTKLFIVIASVIVLAGCPLFEDTPPPTPEPPKPIPAPTRQSFTNYFNTDVIATYNALAESAAGPTGEEQLREVLIDTQFTVLAESLIYRLVSVYGAGMPIDGVRGSGEAYANIALPGVTSAYTQLSAYDIIEKRGQSGWSNQGTLQNPNIDYPGSFALALSGSKWNDDSVIAKNFSLSNAIEGWDYSYSTQFKNGNVKDNATLAYLDFRAQNFEKIKTDLLKLYLNKSVSETINYENELSQLTSLSLKTNAFSNRLKQYVANNVIGATTVSADNARKPSSINNLTSNQKEYKAYKLLTEKIVETIIDHQTLVGTNTSVWKSYTSFNEAITVAGKHNNMTRNNYNKIAIAPSKNTPLTKLVMRIDGDTGLTTSHLTINLTIKRTSNITVVSNHRVNVTRIGSDFEIDLSNWKDVELSTTGSLEFSISNTNGIAFRIAFTGYYG